MVLGVRDLDRLVEMDLPRVKEVGMRNEDMKRFLTDQGAEKLMVLDSTDSLGLSGWDKLNQGLHGKDLHQEVHPYPPSHPQNIDAESSKFLCTLRFHV